MADGARDSGAAAQVVAEKVVAQGGGGASGSGDGHCRQQRAMTKPQPRESTLADNVRAPRSVARAVKHDGSGVSVCPSLAHIGLVREDASGRRAGVMFRRSSTMGAATPLVRRCREAPNSVPCRSRSLTKPREQSE